jgi:phosphatidylserine/phosphatidylglycerophosphate/cardiolipin synthase-like enzyme
VHEAARRAIAQRLVALHQAGCRVSVVTHPQETSAEILQILQGGGIPVSLLAPIHSKYLLMDAMYEGRRQQLVFTGSHNYTGPALAENDETLLRLAHPGLYEAFLADWRRLAAHPLVE